MTVSTNSNAGSELSDAGTYWWTRALSIDDRLELLATQSKNLYEPGGEGDRLYEEWERLSPFVEDDQTMGGSALLYGCDAEKLKAALDVDPSAIVGELRPAWLDVIEESFEKWDSHRSTEGEADLAPLRVLASFLVGPLTQYHTDCVIQTLRVTCPESHHSPFELANFFRDALEERLFATLMPSLLVELHEARLSSQLAGESGEERFLSFVRIATRAEWRKLLYAQVASPLVVYEPVEVVSFAAVVEREP